MPERTEPTAEPLYRTTTVEELSPVFDLAQCDELTSVCDCGTRRMPQERACWECLATDPSLQS